MVLVLAAAALAVILAVALVLTIRAGRREDTPEPSSTKLPTGADAAIWSILEVVPDPRNHLALTRDLTGEVRIAGTPLDPAWRAATPATTIDPADLWAAEPMVTVDLSDTSLDLAALERAS